MIDLKAASDNAVGADDLLGLAAMERPAPPSGRQWLAAAALGLAALIMATAMLVVAAIGERKAALHAAERARLEAIAIGRSQVMATWLDGIAALSRRLTESDLVRMFATDMAAIEHGAPLPRALLDQLPYFQELMADFSRQNGLLRTALLDAGGRALVSSAGTPLDLSADMLSQTAAHDRDRSLQFSAIRAVDDAGARFAIDLLAVLPALQTDATKSAEAEALLAITIPVDRFLQDLLSTAPTPGRAEATWLIQRSGTGVERLSLQASALQLAALAPPGEMTPGQSLAYGRRETEDGRIILAAGATVPGGDWTIVQTSDAAMAMAPIDRFALTAATVATLGATVIALAFGAFWWRQNMAHQQALAGQYRTLAGRLDQQRRMLLNITESIAEWLTVQAADGRLTYVNTAFAKAVERPRETLLGRPLAELLPRSAAIALSDVDDGDPTEGRVREVEIAGRRRFLGTTFAAINDDAGRHLGTVALTRDETDAVRQRRRRRKALEQTIEAFVHAIERRDPFLLGHTRRLRELAIVIGRRLGLGGDELSGLVMAASLSQIGKVFIADAVLTKQGRHSAAETAAMRRHVDHAIEILTPIDFPPAWS
jgi:PAS domain S-box-containing protein